MSCKTRVSLFLLFLIPGIIGMLCMTAGYVNFTNKNDRFVKATCECIKTQIVRDSCYDACCYHDKDNDCVGCYYDCYSGIVNADIENVTVKTYPINVYTSDYKNKVNAFLNVNYPIGKLFRCYYTFKNDHVVISVNKYNTLQPFIAGIIFLSISGLFLLFWIIFESCTCSPYCCGHLYEACFDCCSHCKHKFQKAREKRAAIAETKSLIKHAKNDPPQYDFVERDNMPSAPPLNSLLLN